MNLARPIRDYQAIIFDCDGTLTDSMPLHYVAWKHTMDRYGIEFPEERFYSLGGMPSDRIVQLLAGEQQREVDATRAAHEKEQFFVERIDLLQPIEPVVAVARDFFNKIPMAVASGGFRPIILRQLRQIGCQDLFTTIVTAEDTTRHKPDPDVFLAAAERMQVAAGECLVYEDSDLGITAARRAGMEFIDVRTFYTPRRIATV